MRVGAVRGLHNRRHCGAVAGHLVAIAQIFLCIAYGELGLVRSVKPSLVFELCFEGINLSARHKSGIAVRFPRMLRIRSDKPLHEANSLVDLGLLLNL